MLVKIFALRMSVKLQQYKCKHTIQILVVAAICTASIPVR